MQLFTQIKQDWIAHGRDWTRPGFRAVAFHRFGRWRRTVNPRILRAPLTLLYRMLYRRARNIYGIELPDSIELGQGVVFEHQGGIVIHGNTHIGDNCIIRQGVTMGIKDLNALDDAPILGDRVHIGAGAVLLGRVHIGDDAVIGANAVVLCDVAAGATAVGIPARVVRSKKPREKEKESQANSAENHETSTRELATLVSN
ncbi:MAG: serine O-acetyltransferase [Lentisphaeria bacterium]|jgi:serine O-acetyltransferase